jgi:hypothetical protein
LRSYLSGAVAATLTFTWVTTVSAQATSAAGPTPPDQTPTVAVGGVIFTSFTHTADPKLTDADGNLVSANAFEVARAYVNLTGKISHLISFRVTPDISGRFATTLAAPATGQRASTSYDGSLVYRLKYAYGQLSLEDWLPKGAWLRLGQQQTPFIDGMESAYRYRFQGTMFVEREGFLSSADVGLSGHYAFPKDYGDIHAGIYNGDTYTRAEPNDQKAFQVRLSVRPLARARPLLRGLRLHAFYMGDHYVKGAPRTRLIGTLTFENKNLNLGVDYVDAKDQTSAKVAAVEASGYSIWVTPRTNIGIEGFFRYDNLQPSESVEGRRKRTTAGVAYWFRSQKAPAAAAILADYEALRFDASLNRPKENRLALHCLFAF